MKKVLSLILTVVMLMTVAPSFAETAAEGEDLSSLLSGLLGDSGEGQEDGGLGSLLSGLMGDGSEGEEGSGLGSLLGGLMGSLSGEGGNFNLNELLEPVLEKLRSLKGTKLSLIADALKQKLGTLKEKLGGLGSMLGDLLSGAEGSEGSGLSALLSGLGGGTTRSSEGGEGADLSALLGGLFGGEGDGTEGGEGADLSSLLGLLFGGDSGEDFDIDKFIEDYTSSPEYQDYLLQREALKAYLNEEYGETLEKGDVQIVTSSNVINFDNDTPNVEFGYFGLANYTVDGTDLKLLNFAGNVELLTYEKQEDGTFKVVDAIVAEDGDDRDDGIQKMCDAFGVTYQDYTECAMWTDWDEIQDLCEFLSEHPEYERIEYQGEMKTPEELSAIQENMLQEYLAAY